MCFCSNLIFSKMQYLSTKQAIIYISCIKCFITQEANDPISRSWQPNRLDAISIIYSNVFESEWNYGRNVKTSRDVVIVILSG